MKVAARLPTAVIMHAVRIITLNVNGVRSAATKGLFDWLTAQHTRGLFAGRPVIHQCELHVAPPSAKQNTASDGWKAFGGGAHR